MKKKNVDKQIVQGAVKIIKQKDGMCDFGLESKEGI